MRPSDGPTLASRCWSATVERDSARREGSLARLQLTLTICTRRAASWTRGFFPGVRVGATRIRCGPVLTPLSSSYPGGPIPTDSLAEFTAIDSPAHGVAPETTAVTMADRSYVAAVERRSSGDTRDRVRRGAATSTREPMNGRLRPRRRPSPGHEGQATTDGLPASRGKQSVRLPCGSASQHGP